MTAGRLDLGPAGKLLRLQPHAHVVLPPRLRLQLEKNARVLAIGLHAQDATRLTGDVCIVRGPLLQVREE